MFSQRVLAVAAVGLGWRRSLLISTAPCVGAAAATLWQWLLGLSTVVTSGVPAIVFSFSKHLAHTLAHTCAAMSLRD